jgi:hypothetical protein
MTDAPVRERVFEFRNMRTLLRATVAVCGSTAMLGVALAAADDGRGLALAAIAVVAGACMVPTFWLAARQHYRADALGLHQQGLIGARTIAWPAVTALSVYRPSVQAHPAASVVYRVHSPTGCIDIPDRLAELEQLRAVVEAATGLRWPAGR